MGNTELKKIAKGIESCTKVETLIFNIMTWGIS